jgi:hypothetical protein
MRQKVIVVRGKNDIDKFEDDIAARLSQLMSGCRIVSTATTLVPWGELVDETGLRHALHVYMVCTIVVEWP